MVVASTVAVFATGVVLLFAGPSRATRCCRSTRSASSSGSPSPALHVLGHLPSAAERCGPTTAPHVPRCSWRRAPAPGGCSRWRAALVAGVVLAIVVIPDFGAWLTLAALSPPRLSLTMRIHTALTRVTPRCAGFSARNRWLIAGERRAHRRARRRRRARLPGQDEQGHRRHREGGGHALQDVRLAHHHGRAETHRRRHRARPRKPRRRARNRRLRRNSAPAKESAPAQESAPAEESAPAQESAPSEQEAPPAQEPAPAQEAAPAQQEASRRSSREARDRARPRRQPRRRAAHAGRRSARPWCCASPTRGAAHARAPRSSASWTRSIARAAAFAPTPSSSRVNAARGTSPPRRPAAAGGARARPATPPS